MLLCRKWCEEGLVENILASIIVCAKLASVKEQQAMVEKHIQVLKRIQSIGS